MSIVNIHPQKRLIICPFLIRITINNSTYAAAVGASVLLLFLILLHDPISGRLATHRSIYVIIRTSVERKEPLIDLPSIAFYKHTSPSSRSVSQSARYKFPTRGVFPSDQFESGKARLRITVQKTEHDNQPSIQRCILYNDYGDRTEVPTNTKSANSSRRANQPWQGH